SIVALFRSMNLVLTGPAGAALSTLAGGKLLQISSNSTRPNSEFRRGPGYSDGSVETACGGLSWRPTRIRETRTGRVVMPVVRSASGVGNCRVVAHAKVEYTAPAKVDRSGSSCSQVDTGVGFGFSHLGSREDRRRSCDRLSRRGPHASRHRSGGVAAHSTFPAPGSIRLSSPGALVHPRHRSGHLGAAILGRS